MNDQEINALLLKRYASAETPWGRWKLNSYVRMKSYSWKCVIASAEFVKRFLDIIISVMALIALAPLFGIVALLIKWEDRGPVLFIQRRVGKWGREFRMYKFRSMALDAERKLQEMLGQNQHESGVTFKIKDDPRVTRSGKWLRKFSIDEFPQFYNVLIGDMSLVGPRPPLPREVAMYSPADRRRLEAAPGLTCFWQIGGRAEIDFPEQVLLDVQYIESQSLWLDMKILVKTIPAVLFGRGAC
jgi:lipopolysaccharide/colanic/teichoic acid biosynthesis glycosyltransferase